ncbi:MAG: NrpR regulatory domain-containing protein [Actinomycetota bacterium]|nr:NrpR regulatory domain-containing protein [Actinomycetota bacterium]
MGYNGASLERKTLAILEILQEAGEPLGARAISRELALRGVDLNERTVRYHLLHLDERGYTRLEGRSGRSLTERGREEVNNALAVDRIGFVNARIDDLACRADFDLSSHRGRLVVNMTYVPLEQEGRAVEAMRPAFEAGLCLSDLVLRAGPGEKVGGMEVPGGIAAWGTVCSVTLNSVFLRHGIPVESSFGGLLEMRGGRPSRFNEIITYSGSTLDPIEIFIKGKMTSVHAAASGGAGRICASFRLIPASAFDAASALLEEMKKSRLGEMVMLGRPGQPFMEVPSGRDRVGMLVAGGLNPPAAAEELGVETSSRAMATLVEYSALAPFASLARRL